MTILGIDPGTAHTGWAVLDGADLVTAGAVHADSTTPWRSRLPQIVAAMSRVVADNRPAVVAIEKTQVNHAPLGAQGQAHDVARGRALAASTQQTAELVSMLCAVAGQHGAEVLLVHPTTGLARLGLKRGCTDGATSKAYNARWGQSLRASEHHIARAAGVALAAVPVARKAKAGAGSAAPREAE